MGVSLCMREKEEKNQVCRSDDAIAVALVSTARRARAHARFPTPDQCDKVSHCVVGALKTAGCAVHTDEQTKQTLDAAT